MTAFESVSTWRQPMPVPRSVLRTELIDSLADVIVGLSEKRLRVAVDGLSASGKTSFGHELAAAVRALDRSTLRASFDDFKKPWRDSVEKGYDRVSGDGYYRNAPDFDSARRLLLEPAGPEGSGRVVLCAHDPLTGRDNRDVIVEAPPDAVLIVDSVFAFRPEYDDYWDYRIWLDIPEPLSVRRGVSRDTEMEGGADAAEQLHRDRYLASERIYVAEVDPKSRADVIIDNRDFDRPAVVPGHRPTS